MKKSTFILSLLLAFLGVTATAQTSYAYKKLASTGTAVTSLDQLTDGGTYALYSTGYSKYIKMSLADNLLMANDATLSADDETDGLLFSALSCYVNLTVLKISRLKMQMFLFWVSHTIFAPCLYARKPTNQVQSACR